MAHSTEQLYWDEISYLESALQDRYDGFDVGDLNNPSAWDADEADSSPAVVAPPSVPVLLPSATDGDDGDNILF